MICHYAEWNYAEYRIFISFMLSVIVQSVIMLSVVMLSVVMLSECRGACLWKCSESALRVD
jgi:hypothetical protein